MWQRIPPKAVHIVWPDKTCRDGQTQNASDELQERIARTQTLLRGFDRAAFDGAQTRQITMRFAGRPLSFDAPTYFNELALPNFYFHVPLAHGILRANGVTLGNFDFLGEM